MGLISKEMAADLIINLINIVILVLLVRFLLYKPVKKFLDERKEKLKTAEEKAAEREREASASKKTYDKLIGDAEQIKAAAKSEAEKEAKKISDEMLSDAGKKAEEILSNAREKAKREHDDTIEKTKAELTDIAVEMTEKILERKITDEDNKRMIEEFFGNENK